MKKVLVPVDGSQCSERAVDYVLALARGGMKVEIHLLNVQVPIESAYLRRFVTQQMIDTFHGQEADTALRGSVAKLKAAEVGYHRVAVIGHPAEAIAHYAKEHGCESIVMGTRGMSKVGNLVLGSVASQVIHLADVPVTLVK